MADIQGSFLHENLHTTQQVIDIKLFFEKLLVEENFDIIIELGTSFGGLTYILDDIVKENHLTHNIHTFDFSYKNYVDSFLKERGCHYYILDERESVYKHTVQELIEAHKKVLLLCDGGNKKEEFNLYSKYIKSGDIIMAHDYCESVEIFEGEIKNKIWDWFEISYEDIKNSVLNNDLVKYNKVDFKRAVWACYIKQ